MIEREQENWQISMNALPDELWDVIIVGAGPAGATAAIHLASYGPVITRIQALW